MIYFIFCSRAVVETAGKCGTVREIAWIHGLFFDNDLKIIKAHVHPLLDRDLYFTRELQNKPFKSHGRERKYKAANPQESFKVFLYSVEPIG